MVIPFSTEKRTIIYIQIILILIKKRKKKRYKGKEKEKEKEIVIAAQGFVKQYTMIRFMHYMMNFF